MDYASLGNPSPWSGERWSMGEFTSETWSWPLPQKEQPLHVLVAGQNQRVRMDFITSHVCRTELPRQSILFLDDKASMVGPELLFVQMASKLSFAETVLLGCKLCGTFKRSGTDFAGGPVYTGVQPATSVEAIRSFIDSTHMLMGSKRARNALNFVYDGAASLPACTLDPSTSLTTQSPRR